MIIGFQKAVTIVYNYHSVLEVSNNTDTNFRRKEALSSVLYMLLQ